MMGIYPWHKGSWDILVSSLDKLANSFLFLGKEGTGVLDFVLYFSRFLLCEGVKVGGSLCGSCYSCLLLDIKSHPDFYYITGDNSSARNKIKIDSIKHIMESINLSSSRGGLKLVVIDTADDLNISSGNSLLKVLEDTPKGVIFLLISYNFSKVLSTIVSRCRKFRLPCPSYDESLLYLRGCYVGYSDENLFDRLLFNSGSPIFNLSDDELFLKDRLCEFLSHPRIGNLFEVSELLDRGKVSLGLGINWFLKWVIDILSFYYSDNIIYNIRYKKDIMGISRSVNILRIFEVYDKLKEVYSYNDYNLNFRLQLESLLIDYSYVIIG